MLARPHPVLGWLHCQPEDSRRLLDRQLTLRDKALEADPSFSGMPASFVEETWVNWLPKAVVQPFYRDQLTKQTLQATPAPQVMLLQSPSVPTGHEERESSPQSS